MKRMRTGVITDETAAKTWLAAACPRVWELLNQRAQQKLPPGLAPPWTDHAKEWWAFADAQITALRVACGEQEVRDAYGPDLSRATTAARVMELISELSVSAALGTLPPRFRLRPSTGRGTYSDFALEFAGVPMYGEVKRYEDRWFSTPRDPARGRALVKAPPGSSAIGQADRPRSMDIVSKLRAVPRQFPEGTVNMLFVHHPSFGDSYRYVQAALFGHETALVAPEAIGVSAADGLFAADEWRRVSACYLTHIDPTHGTWFPVEWRNPRADVPLPTKVRKAVARLREPR